MAVKQWTVLCNRTKWSTWSPLADDVLHDMCYFIHHKWFELKEIRRKKWYHSFQVNYVGSRMLLSYLYFLHLFFISQSKHAFMATYFALDNLVWAGKVGLFKVHNTPSYQFWCEIWPQYWWDIDVTRTYSLFKTQDKKHIDLISKISLYFFVGGCTASSIAEVVNLSSLLLCFLVWKVCFLRKSCCLWYFYLQLYQLILLMRKDKLNVSSSTKIF